ncbi:hypothetical protein NXS19_012561 [Fusarium pseudograminearum]|nr:hypothetical protein NXS19_012561 [Fusarium pseudograminearum]
MPSANARIPDLGHQSIHVPPAPSRSNVDTCRGSQGLGLVVRSIPRITLQGSNGLSGAFAVIRFGREILGVFCFQSLVLSQWQRYIGQRL